MLTIKNLTARPLELVGYSGELADTILPSGIVATIRRVASNQSDILVNGQNIVSKTVTYGDISGLPAPEEGVLYFCFPTVAAGAWAIGREDVTTGGALKKNEDGTEKIVCHTLIGKQKYATNTTKCTPRVTIRYRPSDSNFIATVTGVTGKSPFVAYSDDPIEASKRAVALAFEEISADDTRDDFAVSAIKKLYDGYHGAQSNIN